MKECVDYTVNNLQYNCKDGILNLRCGEGKVTMIETIIHILEGIQVAPILIKETSECINGNRNYLKMQNLK